VNNYLQKRGQEPLIVNSKYAWEDVELSLSAACDAIVALAAKDKNATGFSARLRQGYQTLCNHAKDAQGFLSLIPSDVMGSSVLCGGLTIVFKALEQTGYQRTAVHMALEELPVILNDRVSYIKIHGHDEELHRRMAALYASVLRAMGLILKWLKANSLSI
jgi:hypothetical protein